MHVKAAPAELVADIIIIAVVVLPSLSLSLSLSASAASPRCSETANTEWVIFHLAPFENKPKIHVFVILQIMDQFLM